MLAPWIDRGAFRPISAEASAGDGGVRVDQSDRVFRAVEYVAPRPAGAICPGCGALRRGSRMRGVRAWVWWWIRIRRRRRGW